jgi:hypothetical protein
MNKWMERALFVNIILLILFVLADYFTWVFISQGFEPLSWFAGVIRNVRSRASYNIFLRQLTISGIHEWTEGFTSFTQESTTPNLPLILFILTIASNLYLVWKIQKERTE